MQQTVRQSIVRAGETCAEQGLVQRAVSIDVNVRKDAVAVIARSMRFEMQRHGPAGDERINELPRRAARRLIARCVVSDTDPPQPDVRRTSPEGGVLDIEFKDGRLDDTQHAGRHAVVPVIIIRRLRQKAPATVSDNQHRKRDQDDDPSPAIKARQEVVPARPGRRAGGLCSLR